MFRKILPLLLIFFIASCVERVVVNNCPPWVEVGSIDLSDTDETRRWMFRHEVKRVRACNGHPN